MQQAALGSTGEKEKERLLLLLEETSLEQRAEGEGCGGAWRCQGEQAKPRDREALRRREAWPGRRGQASRAVNECAVALRVVGGKVEESVGHRVRGPLEDCEQELTRRDLGLESNLLVVT